MVTPTSAPTATVVVTVVALLPLFASGFWELTLAVLLTTVPAAVPGLTLTTRVNAALAPLASDGLLAVTVPVPPTAGVAVVHPAGAVNETNVVFAGTVSFSVAVDAAEGPAFVTPIV